MAAKKYGLRLPPIKSGDGKDKPYSQTFAFVGTLKRGPGDKGKMTSFEIERVLTDAQVRSLYLKGIEVTAKNEEAEAVLKQFTAAKTKGG